MIPWPGVDPVPKRVVYPRGHTKRFWLHTLMHANVRSAIILSVSVGSRQEGVYVWGGGGGGCN